MKLKETYRECQICSKKVKFRLPWSAFYSDKNNTFVKLGFSLKIFELN